MNGDDKIRAQPLTNTAAGTGFGIHQFNDLAFIQRKTALGAHLHADITAFTPLLSDFQTDPALYCGMELLPGRQLIQYLLIQIRPTGLLRPCTALCQWFHMVIPRLYRH